MNQPGKDTEIQLSDQEWKDKLTPEQYRVTRQKGTEPAFSGEYWDHKEEGVYRCVCCGAALFTSSAKFNSQSGWPSFSRPFEDDHVDKEDDYSLNMHRVEVLCSKCDAHLGHVFDDGPEPTGKRYCINSAALSFEKS